jgi:diacylglycerol kinase (ATP)
VTTGVAIIINPISGTGGRRDILADRVRLAHALGRSHGLDAEVLVSERPGHAAELAERALASGLTKVVAWGGDGTLNQVGGVLAFRNAVLGIVPSGSGNGLARELGIPLDPEAAFGVVAANWMATCSSISPALDSTRGLRISLRQPASSGAASGDISRLPRASCFATTRMSTA